MAYQIRLATTADDAGIRALIGRTAQPGRVTLNFEREPSYFHGCAVATEAPEVWVAAEAGNGRIIATFNIGRRAVFLNGERRLLRYGCDLRVDPGHRGSLLLPRLFRQFKQLMRPGEWMQTVILADNERSLSTVGSGRAGLPVYYPCGELVNSILYGRLRSGSEGLDIAPASLADVPAMQALLDREGARKQFFPAYRLAELDATVPYYRDLWPEHFLLARDRGRLVGMIGLWDQHAFKQTRVLAYRRPLGWLRPFYNAHSALRGGPRLPRAGGCLRYQTVHTVVMADNDPGLLRPLLAEAQARSGRADGLILGLFQHDPLRVALQGGRRYELHSRHFLVAYDGDPRPQLDSERIPYLELARL